MKGLITKPVFLFALISSLNISKLSAQQNKASESSEYDNAIGIRFGGTSGVTFKHKFTTYNVMEIIIGTYPHTFGITGLYERYIPTTVDGFNLYVGGGMHLARAYYRSRTQYLSDNRYYYTVTHGPVVGLDVIGGMEYKFPKAPIAISLDAKPYAEYYWGNGPILSLDPGLGVKFTF